MRKIVVLGGSFNPPTLAHEALMEAVISAIDADLGIFVPSSDKYVTRKMNKAKRDNQVYSEYERAHMLNIICDQHDKMAVATCEFGDDGRGHTYRTLCELQETYPAADIYFICGADKLNVIPKWHSAEDLLAKFNFVVTARKEDNPVEQIALNDKLNKYADKFIIVELPEGNDDISSTEVRHLLNKNSDRVYEMCNSRVVNFIKGLRGL